MEWGKGVPVPKEIEVNVNGRFCTKPLFVTTHSMNPDYIEWNVDVMEIELFIMNR